MMFLGLRDRPLVVHIGKYAMQVIITIPTYAIYIWVVD